MLDVFSVSADLAWIAWRIACAVVPALHYLVARPGRSLTREIVSFGAGDLKLQKSGDLACFGVY